MNNQQMKIFEEVQAQQKIEQRKKSPIAYILETQKLRARQDLLKLRVAIDCAENVYSYDRSLLHDIYREIIKDTNLEAQWCSRKMKTKEREFKVVDEASGKVDVELTKVLETQWFSDWMDACLDSMLWGFTMIEFGEFQDGDFLPFKVDKKYYNPITIIDRDNVKPELGVITRMPSEAQGISFEDKKYTDYLMFIGKTDSYGILEKCAKLLLCKSNTIDNWSEWAEIFGMDKRVGYTETQGDDRKSFLKALRDMGTNSYGVFTSRDKVEYLGTNRADAYRVYKEFLTYIDEQVAKTIFGQDVVSNNTGRVVGTVGENMANMYGSSDAKFIKHLVNKRLFPFMENLGFNWKGKCFEWGNTEKMSMLERSTVDLQIKGMGFKHSVEYINDTYGTDVEELPEIEKGLNVSHAPENLPKKNGE